jgi:glycosidase
MGSYYSVKDYNAVNPDYGTMQDWINLVKQAHALGMKVLEDWVPNHTAPDNPWIERHPDFYKKDSLGKPAIPFDWTDTRQLDYSNREMRDSMIAAMEWWVRETGIDGFRCDVAWNIPADFWKECIGRLHGIKDVFMLAEGDAPWLHEAGFDETYTWNVMNIAYGIYSGRTSISQLDSVINRNNQTFPKNSFRLYFTSNHDENSWNGTEFKLFGEAYKSFAVWAFTQGNSVPLIYNGQEEPDRKMLKFFVKDTIPWKLYALAPFYRTLIMLRRKDPALSASASFRKINTGNDQEIYGYYRQQGRHKVLVLLNFSAKPQNIKLKEPALTGSPRNVFTGASEKIGPAATIHLAPWDFLLCEYEAK